MYINRRKDHEGINAARKRERERQRKKRGRIRREKRERERKYMLKSARRADKRCRCKRRSMNVDGAWNVPTRNVFCSLSLSLSLFPSLYVPIHTRIELASRVCFSSVKRNTVKKYLFIYTIPQKVEHRFISMPSLFFLKKYQIIWLFLCTVDAVVRVRESRFCVRHK